MSATVDALREHLALQAPRHFTIDGPTLHVNPYCSRVRGPALTADLDATLEYLQHHHIDHCERCAGAPSHASQVAWILTTLPEAVFSDPAHDTPLAGRARLTPFWLSYDPAVDGADGCCERGDFGGQTWLDTACELAAQRAHAYLTSRAAEQGEPAAVIAVGAEVLQAPPVAGLVPLDELAYVHPLTTANAFGRGARTSAIALLPLPQHLAELAIARGGAQVDLQHLSPHAWPLARRLLTSALEAALEETSTVQEAEAHVAAEAPGLLAVAHTATH